MSDRQLPADGRIQLLVLRLVGATQVRGALFVSLIAALLVLPPLGQRIIATGGFNGDDEARAVLLARNMVERGVWFDVHYRGALFRDKPPLYPWLIAAFSRVRGRVTEATAGAPVALATIGVVLFTFLLGDRLFHRRAALWAALILVTSYDFFVNSQQLLPDMLVVAFATAAGWAFWRATNDPSGHGALVTFYVAVALAVFAKGPLGLLPLLGAVIWLWTEYGARQIPTRLWSPAGLGLFALITLTWLGPFLALGARSWVENTVWGDWLTWYFGFPRSPGDLVYTVTIGFLPWTVIAPLAIVCAVRAWRTPTVRFALLWFAIPLLVLLLSAHQKRRYSLSVYPGVALLVAWWADAQGTARTTAGRVIGWLALGSSAATIVALHVPQWWDPDTRRYLSGLSWQLLPLIVGITLIGVAMFWGLQSGRPALLVHGVVTAMVVILAYGIWPYNTRHNEIWNFKQLAASVDRYARGGDAAVFQHRYDWMSIDFYLGRQPRSIDTVEGLREYLTQNDRPVVVVEDRAWRAIQRELSPDARVIEQMTIGREKMLIVTAPSAFR